MIVEADFEGKIGSEVSKKLIENFANMLNLLRKAMPKWALENQSFNQVSV